MPRYDVSAYTSDFDEGRVAFDVVVVAEDEDSALEQVTQAISDNMTVERRSLELRVQVSITKTYSFDLNDEVDDYDSAEDVQYAIENGDFDVEEFCTPDYETDSQFESVQVEDN